MKKNKLVKANESNTPILNTISTKQKVSPGKQIEGVNVDNKADSYLNRNIDPSQNTIANYPSNAKTITTNNIKNTDTNKQINSNNANTYNNSYANLSKNTQSNYSNTRTKSKPNANTDETQALNQNTNSNAIPSSNAYNSKIDNTNRNLNPNIYYDNKNIIPLNNTNAESNKNTSNINPKSITPNPNVSKGNTNSNNNDEIQNSYANITNRKNSSKAASLEAQESYKKSKSMKKAPLKTISLKNDNDYYNNSTEIHQIKTEESEKTNKPNKEKVNQSEQKYAKIKEEEEPPYNEIKHVPILSKEEIEENIQKIFLNHAKYSHKQNDYYISHYDLMKLLQQCQLISQSKLKSTHIEILFKKINCQSNKINQQNFMSLLMRIAKNIYPEQFKENPKNTFNYFITYFIETFKHIITDKYKDSMRNEDDNYCSYNQPFKSIERLIEYVPDDKQRYYITKILYTLREIYVKYFTYETDKSKELSKQSHKNLIKAMRDLEIYPFIIDDTQLMTYYYLTVNQKPYYYFLNEKTDIGQDFTLEKFCLMIVHLSILSYIKTEKVNDEEKEKEIVKLIIFLEKIENSRGMKGFCRKLNRPATSKLTLICPKEVFDQLGESVTVLLPQSNSLISSNPIVNKDEKSKRSQNKPINLKEILPQCNASVISLVENYLNEIAKTFLYFSNQGDKLNYNQISISSYMKLIKHCGLLREIPKKKQEEYYTVSKDLMEKTRQYLGKLKGYRENSPQHQFEGPDLTKEEQNYKRELSKIVNTSSEDGKIGKSDINIIFSSLTGPKNFDYNCYCKHQLDKNYGYCTSFNIPNQINQKEFDHMMLRMNFSIFLQSLCLISKRLYPNENPSNSLQALLTNYILPNLINEDNKSINIRSSISRKDNDTIDVAYELMQAKDIQTFLKKLAPALSRYYTFYCDDNKNMSFNSFLDFYKNYGLFPDIISLRMTKNIFFFLIETNKRQNDISPDVVYNSKETINFNSFVYSIGLAALTATFEEKYSSIDKLLYLIERVNQSDGVRKIRIETGRT